MTPAPPDVWGHPAIVVRESSIAGRGLFASTDIDAGVVVLRLGGRLVDSRELEHLIATVIRGGYVDSVAVAIDLHLVLPPDTIAHYGNHSCVPNLWVVGPYELATCRRIAAGEELTIDYGTISDGPSFRMACACGAPTCRGVVTGEDWRRADLRGRFAGHWPPGLARRISGLGRDL